MSASYENPDRLSLRVARPMVNVPSPSMNPASHAASWIERLRTPFSALYRIHDICAPPALKAYHSASKQEDYSVNYAPALANIFCGNNPYHEYLPRIVYSRFLVRASVMGSSCPIATRSYDRSPCMSLSDACRNQALVSVRSLST